LPSLIDGPGCVSILAVPWQYPEPGRIYELEILATGKGGNQTITEGDVCCTPPITAANCQKP
jgi:hypothetical protein